MQRINKRTLIEAELFFFKISNISMLGGYDLCFNSIRFFYYTPDRYFVRKLVACSGCFLHSAERLEASVPLMEHSPMKAMILAAGVGSRLGSLTLSKPKCLQEIGDKTILEYVLMRIKEIGIEEIAINLHHFPDQIKQFLKSHDYFGLKCNFSYEEELLDTGGGVFRCRQFLEGDDFILHNSDIYSTFSLDKLRKAHLEHGAIAMLACSDNEDQRKFLFDSSGSLCGWENSAQGTQKVVANMEPVRALGFAGVHMISGRIFSLYSPENEAFSIIDAYLKLAEGGHSVRAFEVGVDEYVDIGTPERLEQLRSALKILKDLP